MRAELEIEKQAAFAEIETERAVNEKLYTEKLERLELEKFKYKCSKELFETEKNAVHGTMQSRKNIATDFIPFQSTVLDDIEKILRSSSKCSLHSIQMMVKEATQRCRDLNLPFEFKQVHVADENGKFRYSVRLYDHENCQTAEWPPTRLEIWLDCLREDDNITKDNIFGSIDVNWTYDDYNPDESCILNESINSSKISLNLSAIKDSVFNTPKSRCMTKPNQNKPFTNVSEQTFNLELENMSPSNNQIKSVRSFSQKANSYMKDIHTSALKLKRLCKTHADINNQKINCSLLNNIQDIEFLLEKMKQTINCTSIVEKVSQKSPKSYNF